MTGKHHIYHGLRQGETLVWTGTPCEYKDYGRIDRVLLPVSAVLLALSTFFAMLLGFSIARTGFMFKYAASILMLIAVGGLAVYSMFFRFLIKRRNKADFAYGVTSQGRVLICDHAMERTYAYERGQLRDAVVTEVDKHGTGTIYLVPKDWGYLLDNTGLDFFGLRSGIHVALFDVPDCKKVLKLIKPSNKRK